MIKRFRKNILKDQKGANELFKREIANTRQFVKDIISERRESAKIINVQHFSSRT